MMSFCRNDSADPAAHGTCPAAITVLGSFRLRSYQAEMVAESLKSNIICVMDTGSGKTHIAIERTRLELETCSRNKLVWFLAPTVTLCEQQYDNFRSALPGYGIQILSGRDDVDHWTEKKVWDGILQNVRIVVSTHQVLLDALTHAFVDLSRLALLVFDEAHHCTRQHPARRIMRDFYMMQHDHDRETMQRPAILGLTASPVMRATVSLESLQQIEQNLCATVKTPRLHRSELSRFVHMPKLVRVTYPVENNPFPQPSLMSALTTLSSNYDLMTDPYVVKLLQEQDDGHDVSQRLQKVFLTGKTYCSTEIRTLFAKAKAMFDELGSSPAEWYIQGCIDRLPGTYQGTNDQLADWSLDEKRHLIDVLQGLRKDVPAHELDTPVGTISRKVQMLLDLLVEIATERPTFTAIAFIEQRVWVAALAEIFSKHPGIGNLFKFGTFVGTSESSKRRGTIANLIEPPNQPTTLDEFRAGRINLILATSVLEEGIDISSCHLVIDFERPKNLKSYVQRRGRARMQESRYIIFLPEVNAGKTPEAWHSLEKEMKAAYMDDLRRSRDANQGEEDEEEAQRYLRVASTGALLTLDNASQHLHHFCAILGSGPYVDPRPQFDFTKSKQGFFNAQVSLPIFVDPTVRTTRGTEYWRTERMAQRDAAFEAYLRLHESGLVNDNLLPAQQKLEEGSEEFRIPDQPSLVMAQPALNPWQIIAHSHVHDDGCYNRTLLTVRMGTEKPMHMVLFTKLPMPELRDIVLHWNELRHCNVSIASQPRVNLQEEEVVTMRQVTFQIMRSVYGSRMHDSRNDFLWMFLPCDELGNVSKVQSSLCSNGRRSMMDVIRDDAGDTSTWGLVSLVGDGRKYIPMHAVRRVDEESERDDILLYATILPKRRDFLHAIVHGINTNQAHTRTEELNALSCTMESVPATYSVFALMLPSILYKMEVGLVAQTLMSTLLEPVAFDTARDISLIVQALSSSNIGEDDNYQRLEFLGDCILKFITSIHLMAKYPVWPEGHLTSAKGRIVCNGSLANAGLAAGLDKFILRKRFTGNKWSPPYVADLLEAQEPTKEQISSKTVADVVESLIGAAFVVGSIEKAFACVQVLLPQEPWISVSAANNALFESVSVEGTTTNLNTIETLVGHTFRKKMLLLEALTHASYTGPHALCSYERLEFLGDAVLDQIISTRMFSHQPALSHKKMHGIRSAMVNASFLAFRAIETTITETIVDKTSFREEEHPRSLWQFMRFSEPHLQTARKMALKLHAAARIQILDAMEQDERFPWHLLGLLDSPKELSDMVESVLGAIYIDTCGDLAACEAYCRRLGILDCLDHILRNGVDCFHPKERLGVLAVDCRVNYISCKVGGAVDINEGPWRCQVQVNGEMVGGVVPGLKRLSAETMAAYRACLVMERQMDMVMSDDDEVFFDAEESGGVRLDS